MLLSRCLALSGFGVLLLGILAWAHRHTPPPPVYDELRQDEASPLIPLGAQRDFVFEFDAPAARIRGLWLQHLFTDPETDVLIQVENRTQSALLLREHVGQGYQHWARIPATNQRGDRMAVTYRVLRSRQEQFPAIVQAIKRSAVAPRYPLEVKLGGLKPEQSDLFPLFLVRYHHPLRFLLFLWPVVLAGVLFLYRREGPQGERFALLVLLSLAAAATSYLIWTQGYELHPRKFDSAGQLAYAESLSRGLAPGPAHLDTVRPGPYPQAHFPLVPALSALLSRTGLPVPVCYLWIAGVASFGVLLLLDSCLVGVLQVRPRTAVLVTALLGTHLAFTQGFAYPSPVSMMTLLALGACATLSFRAYRAFQWPWELLFGFGLLAMALVQSPGIGCALCTVVLALVLDLVRSRKFDLTTQSRALEFHLLPPAVVFGLLALGFDWGRSMAAFRAEAVANQHLSTWICALPPFLMSMQALLAAAPGMRWRDLRRVPLLLPLCWGLFFLTASAAALEPFQLRSFLPVLPLVHLLVAPGLERWEAQKPRFVVAAVLILAAANLWGAFLILEQRGASGSWMELFSAW